MVAVSENDRRITVVLISLFTWLGGGEYSLYHLVRNLDRSRVRAIVMVNQAGPLVEKMKASGIEFILAPFEVAPPAVLLQPGKIWQNMKASFAIERMLKEYDTDLVQCSDVFTLLLLVPSLVRRRIPVVYSVIVFYGLLRSMLFNLLAVLFVRQIVTNSRAVRNDLLGKTMFLKGRTTVAYNGVDKEAFHPRPIEERARLRRQLGLPAGRKIVGFIGRYEVWKGHRTFLDAAGLLGKRGEGLCFLLVGDPITGRVAPQVSRYHREVMDRLAELGLSGSTIVWGHRDDIAEIMAALDVFVCPSDAEPFGLVALEAWVSGVPTVLSRTVGAVEVLGEKPGVFISEPRDPESLAGQILRALEYAPSVQAAPPAVQNGEMSWSGYARAFEAVYEKAAA